MTDLSVSIRVTVVYALPERYWSVPLVLPADARVADALVQARLRGSIAEMDIDPVRLAIFSRPATPDTRLRDGDRIEILRPLLADPKQARRERASDTPAKKR